MHPNLYSKRIFFKQRKETKTNSPIVRHKCPQKYHHTKRHREKSLRISRDDDDDVSCRGEQVRWRGRWNTVATADVP